MKLGYHPLHFLFSFLFSLFSLLSSLFLLYISGTTSHVLWSILFFLMVR